MFTVSVASAGDGLLSQTHAGQVRAMKGCGVFTISSYGLEIMHGCTSKCVCVCV